MFSGYYPIEVTQDDYRKTVGYNIAEEEEDEGRNCMTPPKSVTRRLGTMLMTTRGKKKSDISNQMRDASPPRSQCGSSVSGISNQGQQSVTNKTVDSQATVKVSNINHLAACLDKSEQTGEEEIKRNKHSKTWKTLKRLVKGQSQKSFVPSSSASTSLMMTSSQRKHAVSYDGAQTILGKSMLTSTYPIEKRIQSEEGARRGLGHHHSTPTMGVNSKSFFGRGPLSASTVVGATHKQSQNVYCSGGASVPGSEACRSQRSIDNAIQGRRDGVDILSLGPVSRSSLPALQESTVRSRDKKIISPQLFAFVAKESDSTGFIGIEGSKRLDPLHICFTDMPSAASPADLVSDMLWASAGSDQTELILEGFYPGGNDRWTARISADDQTSSNGSRQSHFNDSHCPPTLQSTTDDDESTGLSSQATDDGSTNLPANILWNKLWGQSSKPAPPIPSHMKRVHTISPSADENDGGFSSPFDEEDNILQFASTCNVPFDLDEDAFIIDGPGHLQSVHELAMVSLQSRHFDSALSVFQKLLRGLQDSPSFFHLIGSTHHNIGMIHLIQGNYGYAMRAFEEAIQYRKKHLPPNHRDIAVSIQRKGIAYFGLNALEKAASSFEIALKYFPDDNTSRAKILNNIGVVRYLVEDYAKALKSLMLALEIQRQWLEGSIRRESIVYDASVTLANIGKVYSRKGDYDLAYFVFEEACLMQTWVFRKDHDIVLLSLDNMARVHAKNGNQAEALRIFTSLARSQEARYGGDSEVFIETIGMKGLTHFNLLEFDEALDCMNRVLLWQKQHLRSVHPSIQCTIKMIQQIERCVKGEEELWV
jgi:tetratricopeptide (TPR) repeat protein